MPFNTHLLRVAAICPVGDAQAWRDRRMSSLIQYAKKVRSLFPLSFSSSVDFCQCWSPLILRSSVSKLGLDFLTMRTS